MTSFLTNYEKYLAGEPLTEELAELRRGDDQAHRKSLTGILEAFAPRAQAGGEDRPLSRDERLALKEAQQAGGVTTIIRLLHMSLRAKIEAARIDSEIDPLARSAEIGRSWAYVAIYRRICLEIEGMITVAIAELDDAAHGAQGGQPG